MHFETWWDWGACGLFRLNLDIKAFLSTSAFEKQLTQLFSVENAEE